MLEKNNQRAKVLLVDDNPANLLALEKILRPIDCEVYKAHSGNQALALLLDNKFAVILLDVQMPDMDGFETARWIKDYPDTGSLPIIFVTAINREEQHINYGFEVGAVDYLFKPLDPIIVQSKVKIFIDLFKERQKLEIALEQLKYTEEVLKKTNEQLHYLATTDFLTNLPNRRQFEENLQDQISTKPHNDLTLLMFDLDHFKNVNDNFGHDIGDYLLKDVTKRLQNCLRAKDNIIYRLGGDEFSVIIKNCSDRIGISQICERILSHVSGNYHLAGYDCEIGVSIGVAIFPHDGNDPVTLAKNADIAMYRAKETGRNRYCFFVE